ncbi:MAG: dihydroneopterin triphosphate diphosphatase [Betaproteobacteria bacterium]|nr:MAG: dihydroneopterin triphosphate diphosphatase [Betaproteobacteria bacterium]
MKPLKVPRSVLVVIHTPALETLLIERTPPLCFWQSVTGSQDLNESWRETAIREVAEEVGIDADKHGVLTDLSYENVFAIYPEFRHRYPPGTTHNRERCFALCVKHTFTPYLAPDEHTAFQWMPMREAMGAVRSWSNVAAFRRVLGL